MDLLELTALTQRLTTRPNVHVIIDSDKAWSRFIDDAYTVCVPFLKDDREADALIRGYLDHESAHVLFTDFPVWNERSKKNPDSLVELANIYEDARVEALMGKTYPGSRLNLTWLAIRLFSDMQSVDFQLRRMAAMFNSGMSAVVQSGAYISALRVLVCYALLYWQRAQLVPALAPHADKLINAIKGIRGMDEVLTLIQTQSVSTENSFALAEKLLDLLRNDAGVSATDVQDAAQNLCGQQGVQNAVSIVPGDYQRAYQEPHFPIETYSERLTEVISPLVLKSYVDGSDKSFASFRLYVEHENLMRGGRPEYVNVSEAITGAKDVPVMAAQVRCRILPLLQSMSYRPGRSGWSGRLDSRRLHKAAVGDGRLFSVKTRHIVRSADILLLCDLSGSMFGVEDDVARAAYAVRDGLRGVPGINLQIAAFSSEGYAHLPENSRSYGKLVPKGCTPMGAAIMQAVLDLQNMPGDGRKILLFYTDGDPDSEKAAMSALRLAERNAVEVYGISLSVDGVDHLGDLMPSDRYVMVQDARTDFAQGLYEMLAGAVRRAQCA